MPDCPDVRFIGDWNYTDIEVCSGCLVRVKWISRFACGNYDVYIEEATSVNPNNPACMACFQGNLSLLVLEISNKLLEVNPMGFPPRRIGEQCMSNYRVVKGPCWMRHFPNYTSDYYNDQRIQSRTQACPGHETCCVTLYEVCIDDNGKRVVRRLAGLPSASVPSVPGGIICYGLNLNVGLSGQVYDCENICNGVSR